MRLLEQPHLTGSTSTRLESLAAYLERALPLIGEEVHRLASLRRPGQSSARTRELDRYLSALTDTVEELGALAAAARSGDGPQVAADERALATDPLPALASAYGLGACSNPTASYT